MSANVNNQKKFQKVSHVHLFLVFFGVFLYCFFCNDVIVSADITAISQSDSSYTMKTLNTVKFVKLIDQYNGEPEILLCAEQTIKDIQRENSESPFIDVGKGCIALYSGHINYSQYTEVATQEAVSFFLKALHKDPNLFEAYLYGAYAFLYMRDFGLAESFAKKARTINSKSPLLTLLYAEIALKDKDYEESRRLAQQIIDNETDENLIVKAHLILLRVYSNLNQMDSAYTSFEKLTTLKPRSPWILMECSEFLMRQHKYDKAVEYAENSIKINDKVIPEIHKYLSNVYVKQATDIFNHNNKDRRYFDALNNAITHNPENLVAYYMLGEKYFMFWEQTKEKMYLQTAEKYIVKMLEINPKRPDGKYLLEKIRKEQEKQ
jgi:tetratricopeptide (TPR) repeat protein